MKGSHTMKNSLFFSVLAGLTATAVMTMITMVGPFMGLPPMNPAAMLSEMLGLPMVAGWSMHFMIGVIFALTYSFLFNNRVSISNTIVKGSVFGFGVFVFAQIAMAMMSALMGPMPALEGSMGLMILGSIMGHIVFGIVVAQFVKQTVVLAHA
jgi:hypothetical protein